MFCYLEHTLPNEQPSKSCMKLTAWHSSKRVFPVGSVPNAGGSGQAPNEPSRSQGWGVKDEVNVFTCYTLEHQEEFSLESKRGSRLRVNGSSGICSVTSTYRSCLSVKKQVAGLNLCVVNIDKVMKCLKRLFLPSLPLPSVETVCILQL